MSYLLTKSTVKGICCQLIDKGEILSFKVINSAREKGGGLGGGEDVEVSN